MSRPPVHPPSSRMRIAACLAIVLAGVVVYSNTFAVPFLFDDISRIKNNPSIRTLWPPWAPMATTTRPLGTYTFAVNYALHGYRVWGYHAVNLAIHISCGLLLWGIARRTLSRGRSAQRYGKAADGLALAIAMVWVVHPLQTQAVTYIVQRLESLMGLFYLATLYCFVRAEQSSRKRSWYVASVVACALGMATKEVMATAPLVVLWYDRAFVADSWRQIVSRRRYFYLALAATWGVLAWSVLHWTEDYSSGTLVFVKGITPLSYLMSQAGVVAHYLRLSVWPQGQCLDYAWPVAHTAGDILLPGLMILGLLAATVWCVFRHKEWGFLGGWFFLVLAPTSSILPIVDLAFEHRMYLPLAAVVAAAIVAGYESLGRCLAWMGAAPWNRPWVQALCATGVIVALGAAAYARNRVYESELSIWKDVVQKAPHNARAHNHLIMILGAQGKLAEAAAHARLALEADPHFAHAPNSLGLVFLAHGQVDQAIVQLQKALAIDPNYDEALNNLGLALASQGKTDQAAEYFRKAMEANPRFAGAHNLADLFASQGKIDEAILQYRKALEANPRNAAAHTNLGAALERQQKLPEAIAHYRKALEIDPECAPARANLARLAQFQTDRRKSGQR